METETSRSFQEELQRLPTETEALHAATEELQRFREKRLQQQQREAPIIYGPEEQNGSAVEKTASGFYSVEREALKNIEENEREASKNIEENEREVSTNIQENERGFVEPTNLKNAAREIVACMIVASFYMVLGISTTHEIVIALTDLEEEHNTSIGIDLEKMHATQKVETSRIVSLPIIVGVSFSVVFGDYLIDTVGRLRILQIGVILWAFGWILIVYMSISTIVKLVYMLGTILLISSTIIYITEVARPELRSSMISFGLMLGSFGGMLFYLLINYWRLVIWLSIIYIVVLMIALQFFVPESPVWLVSKRRIDDARKSLEWLYKNETVHGNTSVAEMKFNTIMQENEIKLNEQRQTNHSCADKWFRILIRLRPVVIITLLFLFYIFSEVHIYMIFWFIEVGARVDVNLVLILVYVTSFLCSMVTIWLLWRYKRRALCLISSLGMMVCMIVSGCFTLAMKKSNDLQEYEFWIRMVCLLLYVCTSTVGMSTVSWTMIAECFSTEIRGQAFSIIFLMTMLRDLFYACLGISLGELYMQWFMAGVSMVAAVFVLLMLPETHGKKLSEIEEYFQNNFLALGAEAKDEKRRAKRRAQQNAKSTEPFNPKPMQSV